MICASHICTFTVLSRASLCFRKLLPFSEFAITIRYLTLLAMHRRINRLAIIIHRGENEHNYPRMSESIFTRRSDLDGIKYKNLPMLYVIPQNEAFCGGLSRLTLLIRVAKSIRQSTESSDAPTPHRVSYSKEASLLCT